MKRLSLATLGGLLIAAGINHFVNERFYVRIMPPMIPLPRLMVEVSGACEIGLGAALFSPLSRLAAWGTIALLFAVFPANVHMALHPELFRQIPTSVLLWRLPLQAVLIAWAYWHTTGTAVPLDAARTEVA